MDPRYDLLREENIPKVSDNHDWSKLCPDLLRKIIESLNSIDFHRAKLVCSDWYSVWKTCVKRPLYPWRIVYHNDDSWSFFDPRENKIYHKNLFGLSGHSFYMANYGNWLLMVNTHLGFYIFNLLTCKKIILPSMTSSILGGKMRFERSRDFSHFNWGHFVYLSRKINVSKDIVGCKRLAVLWIDERTEDYFVAWICNNVYLFTHKKGDESWNLETGGTYPPFLDLAYKKSKLYLYTYDHYIKIIDFSGDSPKEEIEKNPYRDHPMGYDVQLKGSLRKTRIAIQKSGEVLVIFGIIKREGLLFYIFKMNLESGEWERVDSIGDDEMLILGHGLTIRAPVEDVGDGIKSGSICFVQDDDLCPCASTHSNCGIFDLSTSKITWPERLVGISWKTQWFVPGF